MERLATVPPTPDGAPADPGPAADGRRRRGDASRRTILDAACRLLTEDGVGPLTHRRVARAAGVPLARVSYHFPTVDDLLVTAARRYLADFDERLREEAERALAGEQSVVDAVTTVLHDLVTDRADEFLAMVEVRLALARRGRTVEDPGIVAAVEAFGADRPRALAVAAAMFGFAVLAAAEPAPVPREQVEQHVRTVLGVPA